MGTRVLSNLTLGLTGLLGLALAYAASIGPLAWATLAFHLPTRLVEVFYTPLLWLHAHTALRGPLDGWIQLFVQLPVGRD